MNTSSKKPSHLQCELCLRYVCSMFTVQCCRILCPCRVMEQKTTSSVFIVSFWNDWTVLLISRLLKDAPPPLNLSSGSYTSWQKQASTFGKMSLLIQIIGPFITKRQHLLSVTKIAHAGDGFVIGATRQYCLFLPCIQLPIGYASAGCVQGPWLDRSGCGTLTNCRSAAT